MGGASTLGDEQITLRAFIFVGVGTEEKCTAAPHYWHFTVDGDILENGGDIRKRGVRIARRRERR
jgi:hypothetical protein